MVSITQFLSSVYYKKSVKTDENQIIITKESNLIFHQKSHDGLLQSRRDPSNPETLTA